MKAYFLPIVLLVCAVLCTACSGTSAAPEDKETNAAYTQVTAEKAHAMMQETASYRIVDVRRAEEYEERHIPEAVNVPLDTIGDWEIAALPDREETLFIYCRSGRRSKEAAEKLVQKGYTRVIEFGGINDWPYETVTGMASWADDKAQVVIIANEEAAGRAWQEPLEQAGAEEIRILCTQKDNGADMAQSLLFHNTGSVRGVRMHRQDGTSGCIQCDVVLLLTDTDASLTSVFARDETGTPVTDACGALDRTDAGGEIVPTKCGVKLKVPERETETEATVEEDHVSYGVYLAGGAEQDLLLQGIAAYLARE